MDPLTQAADGDRVIFRRVHEFAEDNPNVLAFLEENGICPVTEIEICKILPFNQTITVCVKEKEVSLGFAVARYVFVEVLPKPEN